MAIDSFKDNYDFLSNFYECPILFNGEIYASVEHAYQAYKCVNKEEADLIKLLDHPARAKIAGKKVKLKKNWETIKLSVMFNLVFIKFSSDLKLMSKLLMTQNEDLIEGNDWGDFYWGVCHGKGENNLGKILMKVRKELKSIWAL